MLVADVIARLDAQVAALSGRVQGHPRMSYRPRRGLARWWCLPR